jgi:hypothetical protein
MRKERKMTAEEQETYDYLMAKKPEIIKEVIRRVTEKWKEQRKK